MGKIKYAIELEIFEATDCEVHEVGQRLKYPDDVGRLCPWLLDSLNSMARTLQFGGTLPWRYEGTPYEKETGQAGIETEFVCCPDPTSSGVVVRITRTRLPKPTEVGWA